MQLTITDSTRSPPGASGHPAPLADLDSTDGLRCASCSSGGGAQVYGDDPDGFVLCRECRSPLFYCDIGGQG